MVRKEVAPLKQICLKLVSARVWNFCYESSSHIELEHSPSVQTAKSVLSYLPQTVLQNIYSHIISHELKLNSESFWELAVSRSHFDMETQCDEFKLQQTKIMYFILFILGFDERSTRIEFACDSEKQLFFMSKFGNSINSLSFQDYNLTIGWNPKPEWPTAASTLRMILQSAGNLQELDLEGVSCSDEFFKVIGEECNQLKVLRGVVVGDIASDGCNNLDLARVATQDSFKSLLFKSNNERNMCCDSLQSVHFSLRSKEADSQVFYDTITILINNLPNLKSLGKVRVSNAYLQSLRSNLIPVTNIEEINIKELTCDLVPVITVFYPKVKKMIVDIAQIDVLHQLSKFEFLEELFIAGRSWPHQEQLYSKLFSIQWPILRVLTLAIEPIDLNITSLALNFPMLTELDVEPCKVSPWDHKTYFKRLEKVELYLIDCDISWFESFANTVKQLGLTGMDSFNTVTCQILLHVPFPCLEKLYIESFPYDLQFYTSVLITLPKLRICSMSGSLGYGSRKTQYIEELSKFLKKNNLECDVSGALRLANRSLINVNY